MSAKLIMARSGAKAQLCCLLLILGINLDFLSGQNLAYVDSLLSVLDAGTADTTQVYLLRELYWEHNRSDPEKARGYLHQSIRLASEIQYERGIALGKYALSGDLNMTGDLEGALEVLNDALEMFVQLGDSAMVNTCRLDIGWVYQMQRDYVPALRYITNAIHGYEYAGDDRDMARAYNTLGILYKGQEKYAEALDAYQKALEKCKTIDLKQGIAVCNGNIATVLYNLKRYDEALTFFQNTIELQREMNDRVGLVKSYNNIGLLYNDLEDYTRALDYHQKALEMYRTMDYAEGIALVHLNIGLDHAGMKQYAQAIAHYRESMHMALRHDFPETIEKASGNLARSFAATGRYDSAYHYAVLNKQHSDSLQAAMNNKQVAEFQTQFETEQKEKQITLLSKDNEIKELKLKRTRNLNYAGGLSSILAILLVYFYFQNYKHRRTARETRIRHEADQQVLEMEQRILHTVIDTEEKERKRFATDMHDELGPLLSSVMLYLDEIPRVSGKEQEEMVTYTQDLVEEAIREVRDISHNLMPGAISGQGLVSALQTFCEKIERTKAITVNFEDKTNGAKFRPGMEVVLYRVIIELINNTLKHAEANEIDLALSRKNGMLEVSYSDDGKGFDPEEVGHGVNGGIGLQNIRDRIASLGGEIRIRSELHKGVDVSMQVTV